MKRLSTFVYCVFAFAAAFAAPTANEDFVLREIAAATNGLEKADYSTSNTQLVNTIEAVAPAPGDYANVSNRAMSALQPSATNSLVTADEMVAGFGPWYFSSADGTPRETLYFVEGGVRVPVTVSWVTSPSAGWFPTTVGTNIDLTAYIYGAPNDEKDANLAEWYASDYDAFKEGDYDEGLIITLTFSRRQYRPLRTSDLVNDGPPREGFESPDPYVTESEAVSWNRDPYNKTLNADYVRLAYGLEIGNEGHIEIYRDNSSITYYGGDGIGYRNVRILLPYLPYGTYTFATTEDIIAATNGLATASITNGLATTALVSAEAQNATNYTDAAIADADTSYRRADAITNINQTVAYITNAPNNTLTIELPASGETKDWIVYAYLGEETPLALPAAIWWMADTSFTNAIPSNTPTALYFSQVAAGIFSLSRQELQSVNITTP